MGKTSDSRSSQTSPTHSRFVPEADLAELGRSNWREQVRVYATDECYCQSLG